MSAKPGFAQPVDEIKRGHGALNCESKALLFPADQTVLINGRFNHFAALHHKRYPA